MQADGFASEVQSERLCERALELGASPSPRLGEASVDKDGGLRRPLGGASGTGAFVEASDTVLAEASEGALGGFGVVAYIGGNLRARDALRGKPHDLSAGTGLLGEGRVVFEGAQVRVLFRCQLHRFRCSSHTGVFPHGKNLQFPSRRL